MDKERRNSELVQELKGSSNTRFVFLDLFLLKFSLPVRFYSWHNCNKPNFPVGSYEAFLILIAALSSSGSSVLTADT